MSKKNVLSILMLVAIVSLIFFYFYAETYGYPWKRIAMKTQATNYMKEKYNMDVEVLESTFNFKNDCYCAKVYNIKDKNKEVIDVEQHPLHNKKGEYLRNELQDSYTMVYWEKALKYELLQKYPSFFALSDIEIFNIDIAFSTLPMDKGVSSITDENGVYIPLKPVLNPIIYLSVTTQDFSAPFLNELLYLIKDLSLSQTQLDIHVTTYNEEAYNNKNRLNSKYINIEFNDLKDIKTIDRLKNLIKEF